MICWWNPESPLSFKSPLSLLYCIYICIYHHHLPPLFHLARSFACVVNIGQYCRCTFCHVWMKLHIRFCDTIQENCELTLHFASLNMNTHIIIIIYLYKKYILKKKTSSLLCFLVVSSDHFLYKHPSIHLPPQLNWHCRMVPPQL